MIYLKWFVLINFVFTFSQGEMRCFNVPLVNASGKLTPFLCVFNHKIPEQFIAFNLFELLDCGHFLSCTLMFLSCNLPLI